MTKEIPTILRSSGKKTYKSQDVAWHSLQSLWTKHKIAKRNNDKVSMLKTALVIITLQRYLKKPRTIFEGVF